MKKFTRTVAGKTLLFILTISMLFVMAASVAGAVAMIYFDFYDRTKAELVAEYEDYRLDREKYNAVRRALENKGNPQDEYVYLYDEYEYSYGREGIHFAVYDENNGFIASTEGDALPIDDAKWTHKENFYVLYNEFVYYISFGSYKFNTDASPVTYTFCAYYSGSGLLYNLVCKSIDVAYSLRFAVYAIFAGALIFAVIFFVMLMCAAARRPGDEEVHPGPLFKVPFDIMLAVCALAVGAVLYIFFNSYVFTDEVVPVIAVTAVVSANLVLGLCMSAAGRVKMHRFLKNNVIYYVLHFIWKALRFIGRTVRRTVLGIPIAWKTAVAFVTVSVVELIFIVNLTWDEALVIFWLIEKLILFPVVISFSLALCRFEKSGQKLAEGDFAYKTSTKALVGSFKRHAENMNSIADGMSRAVDERMKSERMKTELITNVSHDLKTPLTSIINYAALISNEKSDNPNIAEYSEVLERQSVRLKRLIEDLVEASKAATGNLEVSLAPCDAAVFITQAAGEYEERLSEAGLTLVTKQPETPVMIMADGRRMWRIFDNLMSNICKYSQSGTRVYLSLEEISGHAVIMFKNTSRDELNVSTDELTERFVRGDTSRNTEGSGLGLSIAKSLTELQNGVLNIAVDGDLFKVALVFPTVRE